jgi:hypothetical protein
MIALTVVVLSACVTLYGDDVSVDQTALAFVSDDSPFYCPNSLVLLCIAFLVVLPGYF